MASWLSNDEIEAVVAQAILTPSILDTQRWTFAVRDGTI